MAKYAYLHFNIDNTNQPQIFEIQIGGLRQILEKSGHRFTFMNGKINAKVEEGKFYSRHAATNHMNHLLTPTPTQNSKA